MASWIETKTMKNNKIEIIQKWSLIVGLTFYALGILIALVGFILK